MVHIQHNLTSHRYSSRFTFSARDTITPNIGPQLLAITATATATVIILAAYFINMGMVIITIPIPTGVPISRFGFPANLLGFLRRFNLVWIN